MTFRSNPVLMIFLDTTSIERARRLFESVIGLSIIENQFHPPHSHHGLFKYDAGSVILALNLARGADGDAGRRDGIRTIIAMRDAEERRCAAIQSGLCAVIDNDTIVDLDGHCYEFIEAEPGRTAPAVHRIVYGGNAMAQMHAFYGERLGLEPQQTDGASYRAGKVLLSVERHDRVTGAATRHDRYLTVFYTPDIQWTAAALSARGIALLGEPRFTSIGGTVRLADPSGHQYCLYEPHARCFDWGSGPKLAELIGEAA